MDLRTGDHPLWLDGGGVADTIAAASGQIAEEVRAATADAAPTGRFTTPEEVANLVVFLASGRKGLVAVIDGPSGHLARV